MKSRKNIQIVGAVLFLSILTIGVFSLPRMLVWTIQHEHFSFVTQETRPADFPVTIDIKTKTITENPEVNAFLADKHSLFGAAIADSDNFLWDIFEKISIGISESLWYQNIAGANTHIITIKPGLRKEQVALVFGKALKWNDVDKKAFMTASTTTSLPLIEGSFVAGTYLLPSEITPKEVQATVNERFSKEVLSHYGTSTREKMPLETALIVASLIQRETLTNDGMRLLSGIMWNRIFVDMPLQIDSTLQYAKATNATGGTWWPTVRSTDKRIKSPYNTYINKGLPPTPIATPSVAAILAALNPIQTPCLFYFNDSKGAFHCSITYDEHVRLLKKYY